MKHAEIRQTLAEGLMETLAANTLPFTLYDYQREMLEATIRWLLRPEAPRRGHASQATGLGKTVEYSTIVRARNGLRVLVIVPGKQLVEQSIQDLQGFFEGKLSHASSLKVIFARNGDELATHWKGQTPDVLVTTDDTLKTQFEKIKQVLDPHVIIWDECHWAFTKKAQHALDAFPEAVVIGFSATPDYLTTTSKPDYVPVTLDNGQVLYCPPNRFARTYFPELIDERSVRWGIQNEHLAPLAWGQLDFKLNLDDVPTVDGPGGMDYDQAELQQVMKDNWDFVIQSICKLYKTNQYELAKRFSAAVCPGVVQAQSIVEALRGIGIRAESITQKTKDADRSRIINAGRDGELQFLSSVFALREGWNSPNAEVAMMLRPTKSRVLYMQFMGRVIRVDMKNPDKVALVLDPHYQNTQFAPLSAPVLFGTPGQEVYDGDLLITPRRKRKNEIISPYMLKRLQPILTVQKLEIERWAGEDGTFEADGEVWGTVGAFMRAFGFSDGTIRSRLTGCRNRKGKNQGGSVLTFYARTDVEKACADMLSEMPVAGEDGFFQADGEQWGTVRAFTRKSGLSEGAIKLRFSRCRTRGGKDMLSRIATFYALADLEKACADLLAEMPVSGDDGCFQADGERWGALGALEHTFGFGEKAIKSRLTGCRNRRGKNPAGKVLTFYALTDVEKACADLLKDVPVAGADGFFQADGERWGTVGAFKRKIGLSDTAIKSRISQYRSREGRDLAGRLNTFYALTDVEKACADLLTEMPVAGDDGCFQADGEQWGTLGALERKIGLSDAKIRSRLTGCRNREGKSKAGNILTFYAHTDVEKACTDLLKDVPVSGEDGFFQADGEQWGTASALEQKLGLSNAGIKPRLPRCRCREGRDKIGRLATFYALTDVEKACMDLLKDVPVAGEDGFFLAEGEQWGTVGAFTRKIGLSYGSIRPRLSPCRNREGRDLAGRLNTFYALTDVEKVCADLLKRKRT